jgi:hypothetical protein
MFFLIPALGWRDMVISEEKSSVTPATGKYVPLLALWMRQTFQHPDQLFSNEYIVLGLDETPDSSQASSQQNTFSLAQCCSACFLDSTVILTLLPVGYTVLLYSIISFFSKRNS